MTLMTLMNNRFSPLRFKSRSQEGSAFIMALLFLSTVAIFATLASNAVLSRAPVPLQQASFQQAHSAAEAGIQLALETLNANPATMNTTATLPGWKQSNGTSTASGSNLALAYGSATGSGTAQVAANLCGTMPALSGTTGISGFSNLIYSGTSLLSSSGTAAYVNLNLRAVYPSNFGAAASPWYVIRSMGTVPVFGPKRTPRDLPDLDLRRLSFTRIRPNLLAEIATNPGNGQLGSLNSSIPLPPWWKQTPLPTTTVSRVIQVIVQPKISYLFDHAMFTQTSMIWGSNGKFYTDSWNSKYSPNGDYPGGSFNDANPAAKHHGGNIGSNDTQAGTIDLNGGTVNGTVSSPNGSEGLSKTKAGAIDGSIVPPSNTPAAVVQTSPATMPPKTLPPGFPATATSQFSTLNVTGATAAAATKYRLTSLSTSVDSLVFSGTGYVQVWIDGKTWAPSTVTVPNGVHATVYVDGNIDFKNNKINDPANSATSGLPGDLIIYGISTATSPRPTISGNGNPVISAAIFAPNYDFSMAGGGNGTFYGSISVYSYGNNGGGNLELHYDEALANVGDPVPTGFQVTSYFEDTRL